LGEGVELKDRTRVIKPIVENEFVKGVEVLHGKRIRGKIVIDATGLKSPLRSFLPSSFGIEKEIEEKDVNLAYREIRRIRTSFDENYCEIYLNPKLFPGGYGWIFPQSEKIANVGLGVQKVGNYPNPRKRLHETLLKLEIFKGSEIVKVNGRKQAGGMEVATRRSLSSLVGNGFLIAGEAGCIIDPVTGGGNGQALVTGKLSAEVACKALEEGRNDLQSLWRYNIDHYTRPNGYGLRYTPLDVFRIFLQSLDPEDLEYIARSGIVKREDLIMLTTKGELEVSVREALKRLFRGIGKISLIKNFRYVKKQMEKVRNLCLNFPRNPVGLDEWKKRVNSIFSEVEARFKPYKPTS